MANTFTCNTCGKQRNEGYFIKANVFKCINCIEYESGMSYNQFIYGPRFNHSNYSILSKFFRIGIINE